MAFVEKSGKNSWRVRYWKDDNTHGSIPGYTSKKAAQAKADEIDADQRRGTFLDPAAAADAATNPTPNGCGPPPNKPSPSPSKPPPSSGTGPPYS
jgi:hypothetical protein